MHKEQQQEYVVLETPRATCNQSQNERPTAQNDQGKPSAKSNHGNIVSVSQLFAFADRRDKMLISIGTVGAVVAGSARPMQVLLMGNIINSFNPATKIEGKEMRDNINQVAIYFVFVGLAVMVGGFLQVYGWSISAARQTKRIRGAYIRAIITQEIGWFDMNDPMQLPTRVADSSVAIENGIGAKLGDGLYFLALAISGICIAMSRGWKLTFILLALTPFIALTGFISMKVLSAATQAGIESYARAGAVAQESLSNIRTVHMLNAIHHFINKYKEALTLSTAAGIKKGLAVGWGTGFMFFTIFCTYACGMFYGALQIANDQLDGHHCTGGGCYDGGRVITVFFSVVMGAMGLGQAGPSIQAIFSARTAAYDVFEVIKRPSLIDPLNQEGKQLHKVAGRIEIENITFAYPSRPDVNVCKNYSLTIEAGETVALVGPSGSGKSTIVAMLERFYDPSSGSVKLDGEDIRTLNVKWLREQVGLVGQEPALFATSIMENIRHGNPSATDEEVKEAAKMANAYDFIMEFPQGFATEVGERGAQLSGGQKQRIAIARAIIKNPPILLLDEATSALDTESERIVQASLDRLVASSSKRTTVIIAHRLSTIRDANRIAVHSGGSIVEIGSHDELMRIPNGHYRLLVEAQERHINDEEEKSDETIQENSMKLVGTRRKSGSLTSRHSSSAGRKSKHDMIHSEFVGDDDDIYEVVEDSNATQLVSLSRLWKMSAPEWKFLVLGAVGAVVNAAVFPAWGVLVTKVTVLFFQYDKTRHEMLTDARYWSLGFILIGIVFGLSITLQHYGFSVVAQRLIARIRVTTFAAMLRQEVGWFDLEENASGALVSRLATDSAILQTMTSDTLNQRLVNVTTLGIGLGIAFYYSWEMTLALLATIPIMIVRSYVRAKHQGGMLNNKTQTDADMAAGALISESISSIRTVVSFSMEQTVHAAYMDYLEVAKDADRKAGIAGGIMFGFSEGVMFLVLAYLFWLGGIWVSHGTITFEDMFMVIVVIMISTVGIGMAARGMADSNKAKEAAARVFEIIDRIPNIDATSSHGRILSEIRGDVDFRNVLFAYPSRPNAPIYCDYNLKISHGQTVALVGASGSGKSTAIALLERFYDPSSGKVTLDGHDLRELNLSWLRERIALVSQEPVLFAGTVADNIALGKPGGKPSREEVIEAAKKANAYDFISNFPDGFDTDVGDRGAQVSGGQKQRIAIARAILRDPEVLLLDEATSALDNESERVVQQSLDQLVALKQRTTIIVAHRLSTIRHADVIAVTKNGAIVELGNHDQLMQITNGVYKLLVARQIGE